MRAATPLVVAILAVVVLAVPSVVLADGRMAVAAPEPGKRCRCAPGSRNGGRLVDSDAATDVRSIPGRRRHRLGPEPDRCLLSAGVTPEVNRARVRRPPAARL